MKVQNTILLTISVVFLSQISFGMLNERLRDAAKNGDTEQVKQLLAQNANPNSMFENGNTVLCCVSTVAGTTDIVIKSQLAITKMLLDAGANPNYCNMDGYTPIIGFASYGRLEAVKLLLAAGADAGAKTGMAARRAYLLAEQNPEHWPLVHLLEAATKKSAL